jgi:hypothetical protein
LSKPIVVANRIVTGGAASGKTLINPLMSLANAMLLSSQYTSHNLGALLIIPTVTLAASTIGKRRIRVLPEAAT